MNLHEIAKAVESGELDLELDSISFLVRERKAMLVPQAWTFEIGQRVRLVNTNPKYLNGAMATVKKINRTKVVIDLDQPNGRFYRNITCPTAMLQRV